MVRLFQEPRVRGRREEVPALGPSRGRVGNCGGKWDGTGLGGGGWGLGGRRCKQS